MTVPFMRATRPSSSAPATNADSTPWGGMAAFIPSRKDTEVNETAIRKVTEDKVRESPDGFDGTWVAHPDLVKPAMEIFNKHLGAKPHQKDKLPKLSIVSESELLDFKIPDGTITEKGVELNIHVALQYIESWLQGVGAAAIFN